MAAVQYLQFVRLKNAVSGHCGICGAHGLHDHFDRDIRDLICAEDSDLVKGAERILLVLCSPNVMPLDPDVVEIAAKLFSRSRGLSI